MEFAQERGDITVPGVVGMYSRVNCPPRVAKPAKGEVWHSIKKLELKHKRKE
jgi:hypothetical protein